MVSFAMRLSMTSGFGARRTSSLFSSMMSSLRPPSQFLNVSLPLFVACMKRRSQKKYRVHFFELVLFRIADQAGVTHEIFHVCERYDRPDEPPPHTVLTSGKRADTGA